MQRLVLLVALFACCGALPVESEPSKLVIESSGITRSLRVATVDNGLETGSDTEERAPILASLKSAVSKANSAVKSKAANVKLTWELKSLIKRDAPIDDMMKLLTAERLNSYTFRQSAIFKVYDKYVTSQVSVWSKKGLSQDDVKKLLGMDKMSDSAIKTSPNFKYLDEFMKTEVETWAANLLSKEEIMAKLGLQHLDGITLTTSFNYRWLKEFTAWPDRLRAAGWKKQGLSSTAVWNKLGLEGMKGAERKASEQYKSYRVYASTLDREIESAKPGTVIRAFDKGATKKEIKARIQVWVDTNKSEDFVVKALGLKKSARWHDPNFKLWYEKDLRKTLGLNKKSKKKTTDEIN